MTGILVTWNGVASSTIPELVCGQVTRDLLGAQRGTFVPVPGRAGSWFFPEQPGRRKITIDCFVEGATFPSGRRDAVTAVADWLEVAGEAVLILGDEPTVFYNAVLLTAPEVNEWREVGQFTLEFSAEPYSYDLSSTSYTWHPTSGVELDHDFDLSAQVYPVIEITPTNGSNISGFTLVTNGKTLTYNTQVNNGDTVTINSIGMAVLAGTSDDTYLTGAYDPIDLLMSGVTGSFPVLLPGINDLTFTKLGGDSTTFTITIFYRKRYRK